MNKIVTLLVGALAASAFGKETHWTYVTPIPDEYKHLVADLDPNAAAYGMITNGELKVFASAYSGTNLRLCRNRNGWQSGTLADGTGELNLMLPIYSKDGKTQYHVTQISDSAFYDASGDTRITGVLLPDTVTQIGGSSFQNNKGIKRLVLDCPKVTSLTGNTFNNNLALKEIYSNMPALTSVGSYVFSFDTSVDKIEIEDAAEYQLFANQYPITTAWTGVRVVFRGRAPSNATTAGTSVFLNEGSWYPIRFYIPKGDDSWAAVKAAVTSTDRAALRAKYSSETAEFVGTIPAGTLGNKYDAFLLYADAKYFARDLIVRGESVKDPGVQLPVSGVQPDYGEYRFLLSGETVGLSASQAPVKFDGCRYESVGYVKETATLTGWGKPVTNDAQTASVVMPGNGSVRITWLWRPCKSGLVLIFK